MYKIINVVFTNRKLNAVEISKLPQYSFICNDNEVKEGDTRAFDRHHLDNYDVKYNLVMTHCDLSSTIPFISGYKYEEFGSAKCLTDDIQHHSCINFNNILYFDNEEM